MCGGCPEGNRQLREKSRPVCAVRACVEANGIASCKECAEPKCALKRSVESISPLRSRFEKMRWWAGRMSRALEGRKGPADHLHEPARMPERVISRLRWYLTALDSFAEEGQASISSWQLAEKVGVSAALIRKDLSRFGEFGTPSFGYRVDFLRSSVREILHLDETTKIAWVGACSLRHSTAALDRLRENNCQVVAVFDVDANEIGTRIGEFEVLPADTIRDALCAPGISAAVIAVPGRQAQAIAETLVGLGARAILNLSGELLVLPEQVRVSSLDIAGELLELCYYCRPG